MLSKWLSKPKCDHRWPASMRLSAINGLWQWIGMSVNARRAAILQTDKDRLFALVVAPPMGISVRAIRSHASRWKHALVATETCDWFSYG